jgi:hypothetical protein
MMTVTLFLFDMTTEPIKQSPDPVADVIAERGVIYGDPELSHTNIGLCWTALIQQHFGIILDHPITPALVAQMMVGMKMQRAVRAFHPDNYLDAKAYLRFAEQFQTPKEKNDDAWK